MSQTVKEILSTARNLLKKKMRQKVQYEKNAYKKAYAIKGGAKRGNTSKRSKRAKSTAPAVDGSIPEIGRGAGEA